MTGGDTLRTRAGHSGYSVNRFFGYDVAAELSGQESLTGALALAITGRRWSTPEVGLLEDAIGASLLSDPRIWPLKATRLNASFGSYLHGLATGILVQDCRLVGGPAIGPAAARFLVELDGELGAGTIDEEAIARVLRSKRAGGETLPGFGVPLRDRDVRLDALTHGVESRGRAEGRYWRLFQALIRVVAREDGPPPNVAGGFAAALLDLGLAPEEIGPLALTATLVSVVANAVEESRQQNETMQRLPDDRVRYVGVGPRLSPRAQGSGEGGGV